MNKEREKRKKALQKRLAQNMIDKLSKQLEQLERKKAELTAIKSSLDQIREEEGEETLIPTGAGIYLKGEIKDTENFLVEVGSGVVKNKDLKETKEFIEERKDEIDERVDEIKEEIARIQKSLGSPK